MRVSAYQNKTHHRVSNPPTSLPGFYFRRSHDWQAVFRTEASLAAALDCLGWANWARRRLKAFSHYTFALDDRQKSLSDSNPPTSTKKCWIKAVLRQGHWQTRLGVSLSLIPESIQWSDCWRWVCSSLLNPEVSAGPVDKTAEQSPLSYLPKDFTVTFTNISTSPEQIAPHCTETHGPSVLIRFIYFVGQWNHDSGQIIVW